LDITKEIVVALNKEYDAKKASEKKWSNGFNRW
jgi:hypothetical protein